MEYNLGLIVLLSTNQNEVILLSTIMQVNISFVFSLQEIFLLTRGQRENLICDNPKLA